MAAFVVAHLSDPHLGPLPTPRFAELIGKRITGIINWRRRRAAIHRPEILARIVADLKQQSPDHIAVTGDLINVALPAEFPPARAWLEDLGSPEAVTLVPGNHDVYVPGAMRMCQAHWTAYMRGDGAATEAFPFVRRRGPLALIGLSSAVPTLPFLATGRVGADQLQRLGPMLDECRYQGLFRLVMIHHPPVSGPSHRFKRLIDSAALRDTLARHGAELLIHGHDHRHATVSLEGPAQRIPAIGVPSASEAPPGEHDPAGYNLYGIERVAGGWRCEVVSRGIVGGTIAETGRLLLAPI